MLISAVLCPGPVSCGLIALWDGRPILICMLSLDALGHTAGSPTPGHCHLSLVICQLLVTLKKFPNKLFTIGPWSESTWLTSLSGGHIGSLIHIWVLAWLQRPAAVLPPVPVGSHSADFSNLSSRLQTVTTPCRRYPVCAPCQESANPLGCPDTGQKEKGRRGVWAVQGAWGIFSRLVNP